MPVWLIATWLSLFWVGFAWGQIYKWMDRQGNMHFTDNPSRIPSEYRPNVEVERATPPAPLPTPSDDAATAPPTGSAAPEHYHPLHRRRISWDGGPTIGSNWLSTGVPSCNSIFRSATDYSCCTTMRAISRGYTRDNFDRGKIYADSARLEKAIAETEEQIKEAETMLHTTLPLEARQLGANPEWLKPPGPTPAVRECHIHRWQFSIHLSLSPLTRLEG